MKQNTLYAKCIKNTEIDLSNVKYNDNYGADPDGIREKVIEELEIGKIYEVDSVYMGSSYTTIYLKGISIEDNGFNSILFKFYMNDKLHDIYNDPKYNPYL